MISLMPGPVEIDPRIRSVFCQAPLSHRGEEFIRRFDLMSVQRNIKALGTFGFQASVKGNTSYLVSVPRTLTHVCRTLRRYPRFARLHALLAESIAELR